MLEEVEVVFIWSVSAANARMLLITVAGKSLLLVPPAVLLLLIRLIDI